MKCEKCGSFIPEGATWCPSCGCAVEKEIDKGAAAIADAVRETLDEKEATVMTTDTPAQETAPAEAPQKKKLPVPAIAGIAVVAVVAVAAVAILAPKLTGDTGLVPDETVPETILFGGGSSTETDLLSVEETDAAGAAVKGTIIYYSGATYKGDLVGGKRVGHGKIVYPDGKSFDGLWKDDSFEYGTYTYADGSYYTGAFSGGVRDGDGELFAGDGTIVYKGAFAVDLYGGEGVLYTAEAEYAGTFDAGAPKICTVTYKDGNVYQGSLEDMKPHGEGEMKYVSGERFFGEWKNGELYMGAYTYADGSVYTGDFLKGQKCGAGKLEKPDGSVYEGTFQDDTYLDGKLTFADGTVHEGEFGNGEIIRGSITVGNMIYAGEFESGGILVRGTITYPDGHTEDFPAE